MRTSDDEIEQDSKKFDDAFHACKEWLSLTLLGLGEANSHVRTEAIRLWESFPYIQEIHDSFGGDLGAMVGYVFNRECEDNEWRCLLVQFKRRLQNEQTQGLSYGVTEIAI